MPLPLLLSNALLVAPDAATNTQSLNPLQKLLGNLGPMPMIAMIFAVFYFMLIRPQQKKQRDHEDWQKKVGVGDEVVTSGGLVGKITHVTDDVFTVEVGDKVRVRVMRSHISGPAPSARKATANSSTSKASA
jgi:preprotein translocase subunit YajC